MLKVALKQVENIVFCKIIKQGEEIERGEFEFTSSNGVKIRSRTNPDFKSGILFVKGIHQEYDNQCFYNICEDATQCEQFITKICDAVKEYNQSLSKTKSVEDNLFLEKFFMVE